MVRIAVDTIVWSSAASRIPSINPPRIVRICRWVKPPAAGPGTLRRGGAAAVMVMGTLRYLLVAACK
jgi:hypothetical protein